MAERVVKTLKPVKGSMVVGRQRGNLNPAEYKDRTDQGGTMFRHNEKSWKKMWKQVGESTGTVWDVSVRLLEGTDALDVVRDPKSVTSGHSADTGNGNLWFEVVRL